MAINRIQPVLAPDPEYTKQFPGGGELHVQPAQAEAQAPVRQPPRPTLDQSPAPVRPVDAAPVEPAPVESALVQAVPAEARAPAARRRDKPAPQRAPAPVRKVRAGTGTTAKVSVWVRPLSEHAERIEATGLSPQRVLKAAWQRTAARYSLGSSYVEPRPGDRAGGPDYRYATTLLLDAEALTKLLHRYDPLKITPYWSLIRGQVEPLFWQALDEVLAELGEAKRGGTEP